MSDKNIFDEKEVFNPMARPEFDYEKFYPKLMENYCAALSRIEELESRELGYIQSLRDLEARVRELDWISVEDRLPKSGVKVLAAYQNRRGKWRRVCAEYIHPRTVLTEDYYADWVDYEADYDEENDAYYVCAGWNERIENWDEYMSVVIHEGIVTHWMPLPSPPKG